MRAVIQRVSSASVSIDHQIKSSIGRGLLVLLGIAASDNEDDVDYLAEKISKLRIFPDEKDKMNLSVEDIGGEVLLVSQFTLHADTRKGNRPSFVEAAKAEVAIPLYESFQRKLQDKLSKPLYTGVFGAKMQITLQNDGPVTIIMDSSDSKATEMSAP